MRKPNLAMPQGHKMTDEALFGIKDAWQGDPLKPDLNTPCPPEIVATLTATQRETRVKALVTQAHFILDDAIATHKSHHELVKFCVLYSGGNDSTVLAHLMRGRADTAVHIDTTIGIAETQDFVKQTCKDWGLPLIIETAPIPYEELVTDPKLGMPGPGLHGRMYQRLKERALMIVRKRFVLNGRKQRIVFIAGRRRTESERRSDIPMHERQASIIWVSPLCFWTKLDMNTYRLMHMETDRVPTNPVTEILHMSGECLCGAFAKPGELDEIKLWYPEMYDKIKAIEAKATEAGHVEPLNRWGHGTGARSKSGMLCSSCDFLFDDEQEEAK